MTKEKTLSQQICELCGIENNPSVTMTAGCGSSDETRSI